MKRDDLLAIGEVSARSGVAASALRYYETIGLITSTRTSGDQRRFRREVLRRIAVIKAAQQVGLGLDEVTRAFAELDPEAAPTKRDWRRIAAQWSCIGCGCLSMQQCKLYNPQDTLGATGSGSRRLFPTI